LAQTYFLPFDLMLYAVGERALFHTLSKLRGSMGWDRWKQSGGKGNPLDDMAVVVTDYILID